MAKTNALKIGTRVNYHSHTDDVQLMNCVVIGIPFMQGRYKYVAIDHEDTSRLPPNKLARVSELQLADIGDTMRVLSVYPPFAEGIACGCKTLEIANRDTKTRERIAIYAVDKKYTVTEKRALSRNLLDMYRLEIIDYPVYAMMDEMVYNSSRGCIIGTVDITNSWQGDKAEFDKYTADHLVPEYLLKSHDDIFFWKLENPVKFEKPRAIKPPKGARRWWRVNKSALFGGVSL